MTYEEMFQLYKSGQITEEAWIDYCISLFDEVIIQEKDVLIRLKDR